MVYESIVEKYEGKEKGNIDAVYFDIDGTIKPAGYDIPEANVNGIKHLAELGVRPYTSTGRCLSQIEDIATSAGLSMKDFAGFVTENGAYVLAGDGTVVYNALEEKPEFAKAKSAIESYVKEHMKSYFENGDAYLQNNNVNLTLKPKESLTEEESEAMVAQFVESVNEYLSTKEGAQIKDAVKLSQHWDALDIVPEGISKTVGIQRLANYDGVDLTRSAYAGDAQNDPFEEIAEKGVLTITHTGAKDYAIDAVTQLDGVIYKGTVDNLAQLLADDIEKYHIKRED